MHELAKDLLTAFEEHADSKRAVPMRSYMKDIDAFYGIPAPLRKQLLRHILGMYPKTILSEWESILKDLTCTGKREAMYAAIEIAEKAHKHWKVNAVKTLLAIVHHRPWWDTIDALAPLIGIYFDRFPEQRNVLIEEWMASGNMWLQRICILFQKRYKTNTDKELLFSICMRLANEKEFFIRKGIGWALREYAYVNPKAVQEFVSTSPLSSLSKKEALKALARKITHDALSPEQQIRV